jgi:hypothetical protein
LLCLSIAAARLCLTITQLVQVVSSTLAARSARRRLPAAHRICRTQRLGRMAAAGTPAVPHELEAHAAWHSCSPAQRPGVCDWFTHMQQRVRLRLLHAQTPLQVSRKQATLPGKRLLSLAAFAAATRCITNVHAATQFPAGVLDVEEAIDVAARLSAHDPPVTWASVRTQQRGQLGMDGTRAYIRDVLADSYPGATNIRLLRRLALVMAAAEAAPMPGASRAAAFASCSTMLFILCAGNQAMRPLLGRRHLTLGS